MTMSLALRVSRKALSSRVSLKSLSSQSAAPMISSAFRDDSRHQTWTLVAAAAAGIAGGSLLTLCDQQRDASNATKSDKVLQPAAAFRVEELTLEKQQPPIQQQTTAPSIQATSRPVDPSINIKNGKPPVDMGPNPPEHRMSSAEAQLEEATRKAKQHSGGLKVFSGNGNMALALEIARHLGINLGKSTVGKFADGEVNVVIHENVRGKDVYIVQPTGPPVNDNIMELLLMVSTLRRASARRITVVIPYYGYARQDRKMQARVPISAADVARLMEAMGVDRVIAVDLHCGQIQGFFGPRVPVDNLDGGIVGLDYFGCKDLHNPVIVSPDAGGVYRAKKFKEGLEQKYEMQDLGLAMIVKQRARAGAIDQMDLVGDVNDCDCILVDDMIDTAGTLCKAADVLVANGARRVFAFASHGLLSGPGNDRIANSCMEEVVILNTIPTSPQREANEKLTELSVAPLLAQAIFNIHAKKSISALFK
ncbi:hypothetical protein MPSEU_000388300 [Mayamaea pseudoterrestris]|nr:hypothetical protein MPSEU_000388300 [Mayamaea pseudoterrestris]